jgi:hypothetical protein
MVVSKSGFVNLAIFVGALNNTSYSYSGDWEENLALKCLPKTLLGIFFISVSCLIWI